MKVYGTGMTKVLPFVGWFENYNSKKLYADFIAGIAVAVILIPQVMAYSIIAGLPPVYGLYAALFGATVAAMWGSSAQLSTGPVALVSFLVLTSLAAFAAPGSPEYIALAILLAFLVGIFQLLLGLLRLGFLISFISHAVIVGFSSAAAIIIASTQVPNILGFSVHSHEHVWQNYVEIFTKIPETHLLTFFFGAAALVMIIVLKKVSAKMPAGLIVMAVGTLLTYLFRFDLQGLQIIGEISSTIPTPQVPLTMAHVTELLPAAIIISIVGFLEAFAVAKSIAGNTKQKVDVNQELVGQGAGNLTSGLFQGYPISGSFSRSAVNFSAGAVTGMSSVFVSVFVLITLLFLTPYLFYLPKAILAAIVIFAVIQLVDIKTIKHVYHLSHADGAVIAIVFFTSFLLKSDDAIFIGIIISLLVFTKETMSPRVSELGYQASHDCLRSMSPARKHQVFDNLFMVRIDMSIFFANADIVMGKIMRRMKKRNPTAKNVLISFVGVNHIDATGAVALADLVEDLQEKGKKVYFIYTKKRVRDVLREEERFADVTQLEDMREVKKLFGKPI